MKTSAPPVVYSNTDGTPATSAFATRVASCMLRTFTQTGHAKNRPPFVSKIEGTVVPRLAGRCDEPPEPDLRKTSTAILRPGTLSRYGQLLRAPHGRVHWAGTETSTTSHGSIDGAVRSGERAAAEVLEHG